MGKGTRRPQAAKFPAENHRSGPPGRGALRATHHVGPDHRARRALLPSVGRTKGPLVKGGCRRRQAVTGGFRITKTFRFTESPRHFVALPPLTRGGFESLPPRGRTTPPVRGDVEHSETEGIGKWPRAVEEKSPQGSVRKQAAKTALLAFPPQGGKVARRAR